MRTYTKKDLGCYGHASLGSQHIRSRLANLVHAIDPDMARDLRIHPGRETEALALINKHLCCEGVYFALIDGDLFLEEDK